jgi:hypothetical protein
MGVALEGRPPKVRASPSVPIGEPKMVGSAIWSGHRTHVVAMEPTRLQPHQLHRG